MQKIFAMLVLVVGLVSGAWAIDKSHYYRYKVKDKYMKKICFEPVGLNNTWQDALYDAVNAYNDEFKWRSNINFVFRFASEQSCTYRVKIKTEYNTDPYDSYLAVTTGFHSWLKKPADTIIINLANSYKVPYLTEKTALLMHEMGHVIGLNHTGEGVGNKIPGTNDDTDYLDSLFRAGGIEDPYPGTNELNPNFTDYDIKAIMFLYGYKYLY